jgi:hypothetical protein
LKKKKEEYYLEPIENIIFSFRGQKVILDTDLARLYGVPTKRLNEQVKRNADRFPLDFAFCLSSEEFESLKLKIDAMKGPFNRSQFATGSQRHRDPRYLPWAFTEHGVIMAANVLNSTQAIKMSVFVVRVFIKLREQLLDRKELEERLTNIENILLSHDGSIRGLYERIRPLLLPKKEIPRKRIGFKLSEKREKYGLR